MQRFNHSLWVLGLGLCLAPSQAQSTRRVQSTLACPTAEGATSSALTPEQLLSIEKSSAPSGSGVSHLCTLSKIKTKTNLAGNVQTYLIPVGRSHDNHDWEPVAGPFVSSIEFLCGSGSSCDVVLPALDDPATEEYVLTSYYHAPSNEARVARFLEQATFGATSELISNWEYGSSSVDASMATWIVHQMEDVEPNEHRPYWRTRSNARVNMLEDTFAAPGDEPCDVNSRWRQYAFTNGDGFYKVEFNATVPDDAPDYFVLTVMGSPLTMVLQADYPEIEANQVYQVCIGGENKIGGIFRIRVNGKCTAVASGVPAVYFEGDTTPVNTVTVASTVGVTQLVDYSESQGEDMIFTSPINDPAVCDALPAGGGELVHLHVNATSAWHLHDPRAILQDNTLQTVISDGGGAATLNGLTECSNAPRTFLNKDHCEISDSSIACGQYVENDVTVTLEHGLIRDFYRHARRYVYALVMGFADTDACATSETTRWLKVDASECTNMITDADTEATFSDLLSSSDDTSNPYIRDVTLGSGAACLESTIPQNATITVDSQCWQRVHNDHYNVYDFTLWVDLHKGGPEAIKMWAKNRQSKLVFPVLTRPSLGHSQDRWDSNKENMDYIGRLGDKLRFLDIPSELSVDKIAEIYGASGSRLQGEGVVVCGSPGEVANDPFHGDIYDIALDNAFDNTGRLDDFEYQRQAVWTTIAMYGDDQLCQRVAWALSQILTMAINDISAEDHTEPFLTFYDIFVRHAFGNYRDILKEVAYSPLMAEMLTYHESRSMLYMQEVQKKADVFPDENFAREIMQLFTFGLNERHMNGTLILDAEGNPIQTYSSDDIMDGARAWTGFERQTSRGNIEDMRTKDNRIDPLRIVAKWRDPYPKMKLREHDGYIGDQVPLCIDLPDKAFLKPGATYRYLGPTSTPELQDESTSWAADETIVRVVLDSVSSGLYAALCNKDQVSGECQPQLEVVLASEVICYGIECKIDPPRVVQVEDRFYEYVRQPCVQFPFFDGALKIKRRAKTDKAMCADPRLPVAGEACCNDDNDNPAKRACNFSGERVTYAGAQANCLAIGKQTCSWRYAPKRDCGSNNCCAWNDGYHWSSVPCTIKVKVASDGKVAIVHEHNDMDSGNYLRGIIRPSMALDNNNYFRVQWSNNGFPEDSAMCPVSCEATESDCLCETSVQQTQVFDTVPSYADAMNSLKIGGFPPTASAGCSTIDSPVSSGNGETVQAWSCDAAVSSLNADTIFELTKPGQSTPLYLKNVESTVSIGDESEFEFRNPPHFVGMVEQDQRDVEYEVEAVLDQYFHHSSTPPFLAHRLIQRFGISNPSPRFVQVVAESFASGVYTTSDGAHSFGDGRYGCMKSTIAAILLDHESRAAVLDKDPSHGSLREPVLRLIHFMRAMKYEPKPDGHPEVKLFDVSAKIGQMSHAVPSVFSFFLPDFVPPAGRLKEASLVSPEAEKANTPMVLGLVDAMLSMVKTGLSECYGGVGRSSSIRCSRYSETDIATSPKSFGQLMYQNGVSPANITAMLEEMSLLLTSDRLDSSALASIEAATNNAVYTDAGAKLRIAQQLMASTPEFHTNNVVRRIQEGRPPVQTPEPSPNPYKAVIMLYMAGGIDTYNFLVPDSYYCPDHYQMYKDMRGSVTLKNIEMTARFEANSPTNNCTHFRFHGGMQDLKVRYAREEAVVFANTGVLFEPVDKENWDTAHAATNLFAHDVQQREVKQVDPFQEVAGTGVLGRMVDVLGDNGFQAGVMSMEDTAEALAGDGDNIINFLSSKGVVPFNEASSTPEMNALMKQLNNHTAYNSGMFGEVWSKAINQAMDENDIFANALPSLSEVPLANGGGFVDTSDNLSKKLEIVARLIQNNERRGTDRDVFYVTAAGWDHHSSLKAKQTDLLPKVNLAIDQFVDEMKAQGRFDEVVIVMASEFGRTLNSNSNEGTDHGWGGNYVMVGGDVRGGRVLGQYPDDYEAVNVGKKGRVRVFPTTPWDSVWHGISEWMGVSGTDMDKVLPNYASFPEGTMFTKEDLFKSSFEEAAIRN